MCLQISVCVCVCRIGKPVSAERQCTAMCSLSDGSLKRPSRTSIYVLLWLLPIHSLKWHFPKRLSSNALNPASSWAKSDTHPCKRIFIGGYKSMSFTGLLFLQINSSCFLNKNVQQLTFFIVSPERPSPDQRGQDCEWWPVLLCRHLYGGWSHQVSFPLSCRQFIKNPTFTMSMFEALGWITTN